MSALKDDNDVDNDVNTFGAAFGAATASAHSPFFLFQCHRDHVELGCGHKLLMADW